MIHDTVESDAVGDLAGAGLMARLAAGLATGVRRVGKRGFDVLVSGTLLLALAPLFALAILAVRNDGGPAFYAQMRVGRGKRHFRCWKFRSMVVNADAHLEAVLAGSPALREEYQRFWKLQNDPRVTKIGGALRRSSLDELPQLFNVLRGDMSLIGPRPRSVAEVRQTQALLAEDPYFTEVPGMTGLWQVSGRNKIGLDEKVRLDAHYVQNWSLGMELNIMVRTFSVVWRGEGAT